MKVLLEAGADKTLRDHKERLAWELAQPRTKNRKERHDRRPLLAAQAEGFEPDRDRRRIVLLLNDTHTKNERRYTGPSTAFQRLDYSFLESEEGGRWKITLLGPIKPWSIARMYKSIATLARGVYFPKVSALGGWTHSNLPSRHGSVSD